MGKKKKRSGKKISLTSMLAIGVGIYLLMRPAKVTPNLPGNIDPLPTGNGSIQRLMARRIPTYI